MSLAVYLDYKFNTIKFNSKWPTGAAIVRPPNTEYTQRIRACWKKLPKIVKITLLQFNYKFGHGNFLQNDRHNIFKIFTDGKKKSYRRKLSKLNHKVATSSLFS